MLLNITIFLLMIGTDPPHVKIDPHYYQAEIQDFSQWMVDKLALEKDTYIIVRFTNKLPPNRSGVTLFRHETVQGRSVWQFLILVARDLHPSVQQGVIAHELIHAGQIRSSRLSPSELRGISWMGHSYKYPETIHYGDRPWEKEALALSGVYLGAYLKQMKDPQGTSQEPFH